MGFGAAPCVVTVISNGDTRIERIFRAMNYILMDCGRETSRLLSRGNFNSINRTSRATMRLVEKEKTSKTMNSANEGDD